MQSCIIKKNITISERTIKDYLEKIEQDCEMVDQDQHIISSWWVRPCILSCEHNKNTSMEINVRNSPKPSFIQISCCATDSRLTCTNLNIECRVHRAIEQMNGWRDRWFSTKLNQFDKPCSTAAEYLLTQLCLIYLQYPLVAIVLLSAWL